MRSAVEIPRDATTFEFPYTPLLIKSANTGDDFTVFLEASNEALDQDSERVLQKALKKAADYFMSHGVVSWDHRHKEPPYDPKFIIGEPLDLRFNDDGRTLIKARLYQDNDLAVNLVKNLRSNSTRFGSSVGGYVLHKSKDEDVDRVFWDETAITWKPVNDYTLGTVGLLPFKEFLKALSAGSGVDAATFTGGRALTPEALQGAWHAPIITEGELSLLFQNLFDAIETDEINSYNDLVAFVLDKGYPSSVAAKIIDLFISKMPTLVGQLRE